MPAVYNPANEVCVDAFHDGTIGFLDIVDTVQQVVDGFARRSQGAAGVESDPQGNYSPALSVEDVLAADQQARQQARAMIGQTSQEVSHP